MVAIFGSRIFLHLCCLRHTPANYAGAATIKVVYFSTGLAQALDLRCGITSSFLLLTPSSSPASLLDSTEALME